MSCNTSIKMAVEVKVTLIRSRAAIIPRCQEVYTLGKFKARGRRVIQGVGSAISIC